MRKKLFGLLTAGLLALSVAGTALAHDGWIQTVNPVVRTGEIVYADLLYGNHSNEHASYRIAGKWNMATSKVFVTAPNGAKVDITANVADMGEATDVSPAGTKGYFTAAFVPGLPGLYVVSVEGDSIFRYPDGTASRTLRSAKSFVAAADLPVRERVAELTHYAHAVAPDRAELLLHVNPAALTADSQVRLQLVHQGQRVADQEVSLIRRSTGEAARYTTDAQGWVTFAAGPADLYLARAKFEVEEKVEGQYDKTAYEATLTFAVQRGGQTLPATAAGQAPTVWVNGRPFQFEADLGAPQVVNGRTFLPVRAMAEAMGAQVAWDQGSMTVTLTRGETTILLPVGAAEAIVNGARVALDLPAYVDPAVDRTMVPFRFLAQAFGARVEYLPAVSGEAPAVLVYLAN